MKGGFKRKLAAEGFPLAAGAGSSQRGPIATGKSQLATRLLEQWCWGSLSLPQLQLLAEAAVQDGAEDPLLRLLLLKLLFFYL